MDEAQCVKLRADVRNGAGHEERGHSPLMQGGGVCEGVQSGDGAHACTPQHTTHAVTLELHLRCEEWGVSLGRWR